MKITPTGSLPRISGTASPVHHPPTTALALVSPKTSSGATVTSSRWIVRRSTTARATRAFAVSGIVEPTGSTKPMASCAPA